MQPTEGLVPCPACRRHVRADAGACPFCGAAVPAAPAAMVHGAPPPVPAERPRDVVAPVYGGPPGPLGPRSGPMCAALLALALALAALAALAAAARWWLLR